MKQLLLSEDFELPETATDDEIQAAFEVFHKKHPEIYSHLVAAAQTMRARGRKRCGIKALWEYIRWNFYIGGTAAGGFKLSNNYHSRYARLIVQQEPDLDGFFEFRQLKGDGEK